MRWQENSKENNVIQIRKHQEKGKENNVTQELHKSKGTREITMENKIARNNEESSITKEMHGKWNYNGRGSKGGGDMGEWHGMQGRGKRYDVLPEKGITWPSSHPLCVGWE